MVEEPKLLADLIPRGIRFLSLCAFAFWQGGFVFYAGVVVPLGGEMWGDRTQGFLTRQVVPWFHGAGIVALILWFFDCLAQKESKGFSLLWIFFMGAGVAWLMVLYPRMDTYLDPVSESVEDPRAFKSLHRIYLWVSTILWVMSLVWAWRLTNAKSVHQESYGCVKSGLPQSDTAMEA